MNINATIIFQAFNFFIVYWCLRCFLFRPAVAILDHEHVQKGLLLAALDQQQKSLEIQEKERKKNWFMCQEYFVEHRPHMNKSGDLLFDEHGSESIVSHVSDDSIDQLAAEAYTLLEEKIKNVH